MSPTKKLIEILELATDLLANALDGQVKGKIKCPHFIKVSYAQQLLQETKVQLEPMIPSKETIIPGKHYEEPIDLGLDIELKPEAPEY